MDGYGLTAAIVQAITSLAWPAAFLVAVWLFREKLAELLPALRVKHKDWEASFRLEKAEAEAAALPAPLQPAAAEAIPTPEERDRFEELVRVSPKAAMLELRVELEEAVRQLAGRYGLTKGGKPVSMLGAIRQLRSLEVIDAHTSAILDDLRNVGNAAAHSGSIVITEKEALRYRKLANTVIARLNARQGEL